MPLPIHHVINHSWLNPAWNWLANALPELTWSHHTRQGLPWPRSELLRSLITGVKAAMACRAPQSLLVSHGPLPAVYAGMAMALLAPGRAHLVYSFNFTQLPQGVKRRVIAWVLRRASRFVVFSSMEKALYAHHFCLPLDRIDFVPWAAKPLLGTTCPPGMPTGDFVCAIGSQGRDYATLIEAARQLPEIPLVVVVNPENLQGIEVPPHVKVYTRIPIEQVGGILNRSRFMVLPLATSEVPCGHVTLVSAFHAGKAVIVTGSTGVQDYVQDGRNGLTVPPKAPREMAKAMRELWQSPDTCQTLGAQGAAYAREQCTEEAVVQYFRGVLKHMEQP
jgi:glycosyltransferase involved in cell wall biosynthesis